MGELSDRFGALMARMAQTDAELFRTLGEQNAEFRQLVDEVLPEAPEQQAPSPPAALRPQPLLPPEECSEKALKARFRTLAPALAFLEIRIGPPPGKRLSWAQVAQAFRQGSWSVSSSSGKARSAGVTAADLQALEARLTARIELLEERLLKRLGG